MAAKLIRKGMSSSWCLLVPPMLSRQRSNRNALLRLTPDRKASRCMSEWAKEYLREDHVAVVAMLNNDGSSHVTTMWYLLADDGTLVLSTPERNQKVKNLRRDPRIALCVGDVTRSVSLYGRVSISEDQALVRQDLEHLVERYVKDEGIRQQVIATLVQQSRVALRFTPEKVTEFSV